MRGVFCIILSLLCFPMTSWAHNPSFYPKGSKDFCMNYGSQMVVYAKISGNQYEVAYKDPMTGQENEHMLLVTSGTQFGSDGLVSKDLWVKIKDGNPTEISKVKTPNGFTKSFETLRESPDCMQKSIANNKPSAAQKKAQDDYDKENAAEEAAFHAQQAENAKHANEPVKTKAQLRALKNANNAKLEADTEAWNKMSLEEREKICSAKGIKLEDDQTYCL